MSNEERLADKIFELWEHFNSYVFGHPEFLEQLPEKATLVFLPDDDPSFCEANLALVNGHRTGPVVPIRMRRAGDAMSPYYWPEVRAGQQTA